MSSLCAAPRPAQRQLIVQARLGGTPRPAATRPALPRRRRVSKQAPCAAALHAAALAGAGSGSPGGGAAAAAAAAGQPARLADRRLGDLFLRLLPGAASYCACLVYPLATVVAAVGAAHAPALALRAAGLPLVAALPLVPGLLRAVATTQPWAALLSVAASLATAWLAFVAMPLADLLLGRDLRQEGDEEAAAAAEGAWAAEGGAAASSSASSSASSHGIYKGVLYAYCPIHIASLALACYLVSTTALSPLALLGVTFSAGCAGGILFSTAHELLHGPSWVDKAAANALLAAVGYMHWSESHLAHHVKVATPEDPASARLGETLYAFIPRSIWGNFVDGYAAERRRCARRGIPLLSPRNRMVWWLACPLALAAAAFLACGWKGLLFAVGQAMISILMLETVNYVEHYGLSRRKGEDGRYERVGPQHSWNCSFVFTNAVSFRLQRHADHHAHASKPYHLLLDSPTSPQLPFSYPAAMILATVPPLFKSIIDPRIQAYMSAREAASAGDSGGGAGGAAPALAL